MILIDARNVNDAWQQACELIGKIGVHQPSRNGPVVVAPCPVTTRYEHPDERVLRDPERNANPFFHLFEALWMLAGRRDVEFPVRFAKQLRQYSDDGTTFNAAYGFRWKHHFGYDQVSRIVANLRANKYDRRNVLAMWDPRQDLHHFDKPSSVDLPCNTHVYWNMNPTSCALDMTVCNRSNDIVWGCYGANAVHMSLLHEFVADSANLQLGVYYQISNNWHAYLNTLNPKFGLTHGNPYLSGSLAPSRLFTSGDYLNNLSDVLDVLSANYKTIKYYNPAFRTIVVPMREAWELSRGTGKPTLEGTDQAVALLYNKLANDPGTRFADWLVDGCDWMRRSYKRLQNKENDNAKPAN